jgi:hypothetical protein
LARRAQLAEGQRATSGSRPLTRRRRRAISSSTKSRRSADRIALGYDLPEGDAPSGKLRRTSPPRVDRPRRQRLDAGSGRSDVPEKWVTEEGEKHQEFIGSLDELKVLTKPSTEE